MNKLTKKELCDKWLQDKTINPETKRKIKENGTIFNKLSKKCSPKETLTQKDICSKWLQDKTINPETQRKIKENGEIYKKLSKLCSLNQKVKLISPPESLETRKKKAVKKIHKLLMPYINRITANIIDRVNYFTIIKRYLLSIKDVNNCLRLYNIDEKTKHITYRIGKRIILDKKIGTPSVYGIVFLSHFKSNMKYGTKFDKLNKFAIKITDQSAGNKQEIKILETLTKAVIELKCPHFPISYGSLICNNSRIKSNNPDDYSIVKDKHKNKIINKQYYPDIINKNKSLLIQINELASGDLHSLLKQPIQKDVLNYMTQIFISIMFFHYYTKSHHNDAHSGNFLYHKIKPGGYFHYNIYGKDYYLENIGYLWVIWDFGLATHFSKTRKIGTTNFQKTISTDYYKIIDTFGYYNVVMTANEVNIRKILYNEISTYYVIYDYSRMRELQEKILNLLLANVPSFTTIKPSKIINKTPYIIK